MFPLSLFLISLMNSVYIMLKRSDAALTQTDQSLLTQLNFSGTAFAEFQIVTEDFLKTVVQERHKSSYDLDPKPTSVLYDCFDEIIPIVTSIMNKSFSHSGLNMLLSNLCYRGQSWSLLLETLPARFQFGILVTGTEAYCPETVFTAFAISQPFRAIPVCLPKVSQHWDRAETALLRVVNDLLQASDSGCVSILSLLDLSAAFDTTDHNILITRLRSTFGCSGMVLDWLVSNISWCTQSVFVGYESTPSVLKCGVPQGSVLGPLLFTV